MSEGGGCYRSPARSSSVLLGLSLPCLGSRARTRCEGSSFARTRARASNGGLSFWPKRSPCCRAKKRCVPNIPSPPHPRALPSVAWAPGPPSESGNGIVRGEQCRGREGRLARGQVRPRRGVRRSPWSSERGPRRARSRRGRHPLLSQEREQELAHHGGGLGAGKLGRISGKWRDARALPRARDLARAPAWRSLAHDDLC